MLSSRLRSSPRVETGRDRDLASMDAWPPRNIGCTGGRSIHRPTGAPMKLASSVLLVLAGFLTPACVAAIDGPAQPDPQPTSPETPPVEPPVKPPQPSTGIYVRGSMSPLYQLMPRAEYNRLTEKGIAMADRDFVSTSGSFANAAQKL